MTVLRTLIIALAICSLVLVVGCSDDETTPTAPDPGTLSYVGSDSCGVCHAQEFTDWTNSGHRYKLNPVVGGVPPTYPFTTVPNPPVGYTWDDITYVIGGYGWKARFIDTAGYIVTGPTVQYNLPRPDIRGGDPAANWVAYHDGEVKPYTCGKCHTTGWETLAENGGVNQDGLPGIHGTWFEPDIACERCHGQGSIHAATQSKTDINIDRTSDLCGECHFRDPNHGILASGGYNKHHEQFDEMISGKHRTLLCNDCHDPHIGARHNAGSGGITTDCATCHAPQAATNAHNGAPTCEDCHMPHATKSGRAFNDYLGDVKTHTMKINTNPWPKDSIFFQDQGQTFARGFVTLDFACYSCHRDTLGVGGTNSIQPLDSLSALATGIHN